MYYQMQCEVSDECQKHLNDTIQQSDIVSIGGPGQERCDPVSNLLRHTLRTHAVVLQE